MTTTLEQAPAPTRMRRGADQVVRWVGAAAALIGAVLLVADLVLVFSSVIARYFFDAPFGGWSDDLTMVCLIGMAFLGGTVALARNEHPGVSIVVQRLGERWGAVADALRGFLVLAFTITFTTAVWLIIPITQVQTTSSGIPQSLNYWPLFIAGVGMTVIAACRLTHLRPEAVPVALAILAAAGAAWWVVDTFVIAGGTFNPIVLMLVIFVVVMALGVPVGFALGMAAMVYVLTVAPALPLDFVAGRMVAGVDHFVLLAVPFFVAAGILMDAAGVSHHLLYLVRLALGRIRGGLSIVTIVSLYLFSGVSGSRTADIAAVGNVVMPEYRKQKQGPAGMAVVASGACMGETVPPSTELLIVAALANVSVGALFLAGFLPAVVLALTLIAVAVIWAPFNFQKDEIRRSWRDQLKAGGHSLLALMLPVILLGGVLGGVATPTEVSSFAVVYALVLGLLVYRTVNVRRLATLAVQTATLTGLLLFIFANASTISWLVAVQSFPRDLTAFMQDVGQGSGGAFVFILLTIAIMLVMGWLMEGLPALVILMPLLLPTAVALDLNPLHYVMVMVIAVDIGVTAPPFGLGLITATAIGRVTIEEVTPHIMKYLAVLVVGLLVIAFVPEVTLALPEFFGLTP